MEKSTKVKARVMAHAIKQFIEQADQVFVMGHRIPDLDSIGSSLGIFRAARALGKPSYVIFDESNPNIDTLVDRLMEQGYGDYFLASDRAKRMVSDQTLLIVCDTHRPSFTQEPELIDMVDRVMSLITIGGQVSSLRTLCWFISSPTHPQPVRW